MNPFVKFKSTGKCHIFDMPRSIHRGAITVCGNLIHIEDSIVDESDAHNKCKNCLRSNQPFKSGERMTFVQELSTASKTEKIPQIFMVWDAENNSNVGDVTFCWEGGQTSKIKAGRSDMEWIRDTGGSGGWYFLSHEHFIERFGELSPEADDHNTVDLNDLKRHSNWREAWHW